MKTRATVPGACSDGYLAVIRATPLGTEVH